MRTPTVSNDLNKEQIHNHIALLVEAKANGAGINWPWPIEQEIAAYQQRLYDMEPLVFKGLKDGVYTLANPATNDVWTFTDALETKTFIEAFYSGDIRPFMAKELKAA